MAKLLNVRKFYGCLCYFSIDEMVFVLYFVYLLIYFCLSNQIALVSL